ncbi:MAG TPA: hypothetical protein VNH11_21700 [Pirellulales bacterium]|nr:hypothetical protein [Pirellulales bacterium]
MTTVGQAIDELLLAIECFTPDDCKDQYIISRFEIGPGNSFATARRLDYR